MVEPILNVEPLFMAEPLALPLYTAVRKILVDKFTVICLNAYDKIISVHKIAETGSEALNTGQEMVKTMNTASFEATQASKELLKASTNTTKSLANLG